MIITLYGLQCALALLALLLTTLWQLRRRSVGYEAWLRLCLWGIPLALVGSRLLFSAYAIANGDFSSPIQALYVQDGGASITGAFAGLMLAACITGRTCRVSTGTLLDSLALGAPLALIIERLGEYRVDMGVGRPVDTEWLYFLGAYTDERHPVFLYEAAAAAVILVVLLVLALRSDGLKHPGDLLLIFMTLYGGPQVLFESLRDDAHMVIYFIRINQVAALVMIVIAFVIWMVRWARKGAKPLGLIVAALLMVIGIAVGVMQEFAVDSNPNLLLEYGLMALALALIMTVCLTVRRKAE